jgi:hypothetical protein
MTSDFLSLPLQWQMEDGQFHPLSALVVVKGLDEEGVEVYAIVLTEGLNPVEALGMAEYVHLHAQETVKNSILAHEE